MIGVPMPQQLTVGPSPFDYGCDGGCGAQVTIAGGSVSLVEISPDNGATWIDVGLLAGMVAVGAGMRVRVTYANPLLPPTMWSIPM